MIHTESRCQLIEGHDSRISTAPFKIADILLAKAGFYRKLLLGQARFLPDPPHISPDQPAHVHAQ